jgi:hypothetical protein
MIKSELQLRGAMSMLLVDLQFSIHFAMQLDQAMVKHFIVVIKAIIIRADPEAPDSINHLVFNQVLVT